MTLRIIAGELINAGVFVGREAEYLTWLAESVQAVVDIRCCIDSPDPDVPPIEPVSLFLEKTP
jgi:hypothetical protein